MLIFLVFFVKYNLINKKKYDIINLLKNKKRKILYNEQPKEKFQKIFKRLSYMFIIRNIDYYDFLLLFL